MNPLPDFIGFMRGMDGTETDAPITETEIARDRRIAEALQRKLAALHYPIEDADAGVRAA